jgi:hypothetical protein
VAAGVLSDGEIESAEEKEGADSGSDENELYGQKTTIAAVIAS